VTAANDVIDDDARIDLALIHVLAKSAFAVFLLGPINLFSIEGVADSESDWNPA